jgi:hypothetical protein
MAGDATLATVSGVVVSELQDGSNNAGYGGQGPARAARMTSSSARHPRTAV